jgi:hypothetical protein
MDATRSQGQKKEKKALILMGTRGWEREKQGTAHVP